MSMEVMQATWQYSQQKGSALLLLLAIADNANVSREAWPGIAYLADKTRMSERQTQRLIQYLAETNELAVEWEAGRGKSNLYHVLVGLPEDKIQAIKRIVAERNAQKMAVKGVKMTPFTDKKGDILTPPEEEKVTSEAVKGDIFGVKGDIAMSPEPRTINPEPKKEEPEAVGAILHPSPDVGERDSGLPALTIPAPDVAWAMTKQQLSFQMQRGDFTVHIQPIEVRGYDEGVFKIGADPWVKSRLGKTIEGYLSGIYGRKVELAVEVAG